MHFSVFATETIPYGIRRYEEQGAVIEALCDHLLAERRYFLGDEYSIVDIAFFGWFHAARAAGFALAEHTNLAAWFERVSARPAVIRGVAIPAPLPPFPPRKRA
jgi:GSH-dependent disulfide-bond oxidoreductase